MPFKFYCRNCYQKLEAPEELYGTETVCPQCGETLAIPDPSRLLEPAAEQLEQVTMSCPLCAFPRLKMPSGREGDAVCPGCHAVIPLYPHHEESDPVIPALRDYLLVRKLGSGGSGTVYEGRQLKLNNRSVAVKILDPGLPPDWDVTAETAALARLSHPCIVKLFDIAEEEGVRALVMELVTAPNGEPLSLREVLHVNGGRIAPEAAVKMTAVVASALCYAHSQQVLHLDLKPENILVDHLGMLRLVDFGIARLQPRRHGADGAIRLRTVSATPSGTPGYVAPERWDPNLPPSPRLDVYALGAVLYEALTGEVPSGHFQLPSELIPDLPREVDGVIETAIHFHPDKRYQTMTEFGEALNNLLQVVKAIHGTPVPSVRTETNTVKIRRPSPAETRRPEPPPTAPTEPQPQSGNRPRKLLAIVLASAALAAIMFALARWTAAPTSSDTVQYFHADVRKSPRPAETPAPTTPSPTQQSAAAAVAPDPGKRFQEAEAAFWGKGRRADPAQAMTLYKQSADAGNPAALNRLGEMALYGDNGIEAPEEAVKLFRQAAAQDDPKALFNLGECYYYGIGGLKKDYAEAVSCYQKAMGRGSVHAVYALGRCYSLGHGLDKNLVRAAVLLRQAAEEGFAPAREMLSRLKETPGP